MDQTDIELMLRVRSGDVEAFRTLVHRYREPLRRFFAALLPDRSQADDFAQETFLRLWLLRERYAPTGKFSTYLFQIGKHYWLNQQKRLRPENGGEAPEGRPGPAMEQPETALLAQWEGERLRRAVAALPAHYREVFQRSQLEGLKYAEIGRQLGIPVGTVKSRMAEAVRRLRQALRAEEEEADGEG